MGIIREGITVDFLDLPHCSNSMPLCNVSFGQRDAITGAINQLLALGVISEATYHTHRYVSSVFATEKPGRSLRMILNLKHFNVFVRHIHFKMESPQDVICLIHPGVWMGSVDLKDAYYSVRVHHLYKKFFTFYWHGRFYEYNRMPNGYAQAPLLFTKILKQPFAALRRRGLLSVVYLDDSYLQGDSYSRCLENIPATTSLLTDLGFQINDEKSLLTPTQTIRFLGFILDSVKMIIPLTAERKIRIVAICRRLQETEFLELREVASAIGSFVAALPGVSHGALHYRALERAKNASLAFHKGSFNKKMSLPPDALADVLWWESNVVESFSPLRLSPVYTTFHSDASLEGWGGTDGVTHIGGRWTEAEMHRHINALELHAANLTLQALGASHTNVHIRLMLDNTTATVCINKMGGTHSVVCNDLAQNIWQWATSRSIWLSAAYVPGSENHVADFKSRNFEDNTEWSLSPILFQKLSQRFYIPRVDLFASRMNHQVATFVSWKPEPEAWVVDAFSINWRDIMFYAFPPFSVLDRVLSKIKEEQASGILVLPLWPTQP